MHLLLKIVAKTLTQRPAMCFLAVLALTSGASSQTRIVTATIDTAKTGAPISKNIYGQFLEHGGDIVNTGIWSEMLVDRKFFYPVAMSAPTPPPMMGNRCGQSPLSPRSYALVGSHRRRGCSHHRHQGSIHWRSFAVGQARCKRGARFGPIRNRRS